MCHSGRRYLAELIGRQRYLEDIQAHATIMRPSGGHVLRLVFGHRDTVRYALLGELFVPRDVCDALPVIHSRELRRLKGSSSTAGASVTMQRRILQAAAAVNSRKNGHDHLCVGPAA